MDTDVLPSAVEYRLRSRNIFLDGIPLTGSIDRIDLLPDRTVRIVDYKTGNVKSQNELLGEGTNGDIGYYRQLMFYRIALSLDANWSRYPVEELRVDFVEGKKGEYRNVILPIDPEKESRFRTEIRDAWDRISNPEWWIEFLRFPIIPATVPSEAEKYQDSSSQYEKGKPTPERESPG